MHPLRWLLVAAVGLYCLWSLFTSGATAAWKLNLYELPAARAQYETLMAGTPWLQLAVWWSAIALYVISALRLARGLPGAAAFALAFTLDMASYAWSRLFGAYDEAVGGPITNDYVIIALLALTGAYIWSAERAPRRTRVTPRSPVALT
jgi:hypothetical protein